MTDLSPQDRAWFRDQIRQAITAEFARAECYRRAADIADLRMLTVSEVCAVLGVSATKLREMRDGGVVQMVEVGGIPKTTWGRLRDDIDRMYT